MKGMGWLAVVLGLGLALVMPAQQAAALDVQTIYVYQGAFLSAGVLTNYFWGTDVFVSGLTDGVVKVEGTGVSNPLVHVSGNHWNYGQSFGTNSAAWLAAHPMPTKNDFFFNQQGGGKYQDNVVLNFSVAAAGGIPNITYPTQLATNVPLNPVYTWDNCQNWGQTLTMWVPLGGTAVYNNYDNVSTRTTWQPGPLTGGTMYMFELRLANLEGGGGLPLPSVTALGDPFTYWGVRGPINAVDFTTATIPEPMSAMLVGTAMLVLVGWRYRRRMA